ncbi:hypothetical protein BDW62DRAFT_206040 [Aspergillus aurantiobrunneus]
MPAPPKFWDEDLETPGEEPPEYPEEPIADRPLRPQTQKFLESLPPQIRHRVDRLLALQTAQRSLHREYRLELLALEKKYLAKSRPLYNERAHLVSEPVVHDGPNTFPGPAVGIPAFWLMAIRKHPVLCDLIEDCDFDALSYLTDVELETLPSPTLGFRLLFHFAANPYFENSVLRKTYTYEGSHGGDSGLFYGDVVGDEIVWTKGQELPPVAQQIDVGDEPPRSFFDFFRPPKVSPDNIHDRDVVEAQLVLDYGYGEFFKDELIPNCVDWFTGEAVEDTGADDGATGNDQSGDWIWSEEHGRYYRYEGDDEGGNPIYVWDESA